LLPMKKPFLVETALLLWVCSLFKNHLAREHILSHQPDVIHARRDLSALEGKFAG